MIVSCVSNAVCSGHLSFAFFVKTVFFFYFCVIFLRVVRLTVKKNVLKRKKMNELESKFAQTIKQNKSTIYTVCYMFSKDADEVSDLFQEAVINLWRGFEGFENRSDIKTWIYRVALNTCISLDRKKRRTATEPLPMNINLFEDRDEDTRQVDLLHKRISRLQPFDRAIVLLWLENMPYEEIGQVVGISTSAVSTRLYRIKEQLKKMND